MKTAASMARPVSISIHTKFASTPSAAEKGWGKEHVIGDFHLPSMASKAIGAAPTYKNMAKTTFLQAQTP